MSHGDPFDPTQAMVAPEGRIILSGILVTQADEVVETYRRQGFDLDRRDDLTDG